MSNKSNNPRLKKMSHEQDLIKSMGLKKMSIQEEHELLDIEPEFFSADSKHPGKSGNKPKKLPGTAMKPKERGSNLVWYERGSDYFLKPASTQLKKLDRAVYQVEFHPMEGFYLDRIEEGFHFPHKIYGLETELVNRVVKTYKCLPGNLGVLLNGVKGTGKTVTAKIICNTLDLPVIVVPKNIENVQFFINSIPQDIVVFIDEYEKIFGDEAEMLSIMDGALNSTYRRVFLLTTNSLWINENLMQRPGRVRYLKTFSDLSPQIVEEIIDDKLKKKEHKIDVIKFVASLELITVDIVSSIIEEVNVHDEKPEIFQSVFNVKKKTWKYDVFKLKNKKFVPENKKANVHPNPNDMFFSGREPDIYIGHAFQVNGLHIGVITEIVAPSTFKVVTENGKKTVVFKVLSADSIHTNFRYHHDYDYLY